jgi:ubiquitin-small subunit ribosomal protein S27Ae
MTSQEIESRVGLSADEQVLSFGGKVLASGALSEFGVQNEATLELGMRLRGGHCMVPCGIFDDPHIVKEVTQCCTTIRKAMVQINEESKKGTAQAFNQMTRWVNTKEEHCAKIITIISEYCLCQRVKPHGAAKSPFKSEKDFIDALKAHHAVMICAMKAKQTVDTQGSQHNLAQRNHLSHPKD